MLVYLFAFEKAYILDFHRAETPEVVEFLKSLIRLAPKNCHFIIASRDYPALDQSLLAAEDQFEELRAEDLAFSAAETALSCRMNWRMPRPAWRAVRPTWNAL